MLLRMPLCHLLVKPFLHSLLPLVELGSRLRYALIIRNELGSLWNVAFDFRCKHANATHQCCLLRGLILYASLIHLFLELEVGLFKPAVLRFKVLIRSRRDVQCWLNHAINLLLGVEKLIDISLAQMIVLAASLGDLWVYPLLELLGSQVICFLQ